VTKQLPEWLFAAEVKRHFQKITTRMLLARKPPHLSPNSSMLPPEFAIFNVSRVGSRRGTRASI
jgi:hypothetical protein